MMMMIIHRVMVKLEKNFYSSLTKDDILQPCISDGDFRSSNHGVVELGHNLYVLDIRYQQNFTASQPSKVEIHLNGVVPNDINGYALVED